MEIIEFLDDPEIVELVIKISNPQLKREVMQILYSNN